MKQKRRLVFLKKEDKKRKQRTIFKNYPSISLSSGVYKLLSRDITNHLARRLDKLQAPERAGFRGGYDTIIHFYTLQQII